MMMSDSNMPIFWPETVLYATKSDHLNCSRGYILMPSSSTRRVNLISLYFSKVVNSSGGHSGPVSCVASGASCITPIAISAALCPSEILSNSRRLWRVMKFQRANWSNASTFPAIGEAVRCGKQQRVQRGVYIVKKEYSGSLY